MKKQDLQEMSGLFQMLWSVVAFFFGGYILFAFVLIISGGGMLPDEPPEPLSTGAILSFVAVGMFIAVGCGTAFFLGLRLMRSKSQKNKKRLSIMSIIVMSVPPLLELCLLIFSRGMLILVVLSPTFLIMIAPIIMVISNSLSLFAKEQSSEV